jgi:hypothetical protein
MNRRHLSFRDPELEQLAERFAAWRQCRTTPQERIPVSLWDQAIALCSTRSPSRVAKHLGLCTSDLKKRCQAHKPCTALSETFASPPGFVEVQSASWPQSCGVQIEMQRPDGTRLHLASQDARAPLAELMRTFLEVT